MNTNPLPKTLHIFLYANVVVSESSNDLSRDIGVGMKTTLHDIIVGNAQENFVYS